jgi:predicted dehydrogenase
VGVIGFGWMGRVHAQAHARVRHHFPDLEVVPRLVAIADDVPGRAEEAAARFGFARATTDWRALLTDPEVELVSVTTPNWLHREIGVAVAEAGRHLWIEKPVGLTAASPPFMFLCCSLESAMIGCFPSCGSICWFSICFSKLRVRCSF